MTTSLSNVPQNGFHFIKTSKYFPFLLLLGDVIGLIFVLTLITGVSSYETIRLSSLLIMALFIFFVLTGLYLGDTYHPEKQISGLRAPSRIMISNTIVGLLISAAIYLLGLWGQYPLTGRGNFVIVMTFSTVWAIVSRSFVYKWWLAGSSKSRWLLLGATQNNIEFAKTLLEKTPIEKIFFLADTKEVLSSVLENENKLFDSGVISDFPNWNNENWTSIVVSKEIKLSDEMTRELMSLRLKGVPIYRLPDVFEILWYKIPSAMLQDDWITFNSGFSILSSGIRLRIKNLTDIVISSLLLLLLSPLILLIALLIKLDSSGPIFYSQLRTGLNGRKFQVHKFRSMYQNAEKEGVQWAKEGDSRITRVGYWLRLLRLDELPQFWNVLKGEMSLIGPRPERPEFDLILKEKISYYDLRYLVKPGITGWAQVLYPYGASVEDAYEKLSYDLYYIKNYSMLLDLAIFFKTIRVVLLGKGR
jgi:exopolysaccharide biosynthesis polyprenyl glycosylphosphotransferase